MDAVRVSSGPTFETIPPEIRLSIYDYLYAEEYNKFHIPTEVHGSLETIFFDKGALSLFRVNSKISNESLAAFHRTNDFIALLCDSVFLTTFLRYAFPLKESRNLESWTRVKLIFGKRRTQAEDDLAWTSMSNRQVLFMPKYLSRLVQLINSCNVKLSGAYFPSFWRVLNIKIKTNPNSRFLRSDLATAKRLVLLFSQQLIPSSSWREVPNESQFEGYHAHYELILPSRTAIDRSLAPRNVRPFPTFGDDGKILAEVKDLLRRGTNLLRQGDFKGRQDLCIAASLMGISMNEFRKRYRMRVELMTIERWTIINEIFKQFFEDEERLQNYEGLGAWMTAWLHWADYYAEVHNTLEPDMYAMRYLVAVEAYDHAIDKLEESPRLTQALDR
ncbi:hypothetical protein GLAREA_10994 [Glarea lozoyensis ATCC 20868]|uniref:Uncharacterized protein n=1 Tax=Glarea lozoyensis (strain ATCC 20868 / MF5171) TaxID=1116229 RepID=S3DC70_GLAL2|nr:uncharacterized protein GLAREA_10994 [Glarea lozoyensis ATCC 20868]EPE35295.1 hypothetical protein GLAREA_10994 [Glarea lozoyensis ATCC 20868]